MYTIEIDGMDRLQKRFEDATYKLNEFLVSPMQDSVAHVATDAAIPAPESDANQPPPPYYIRGVGTQYENGNRGESQQLGKNWEKTVEIFNEGVVGTVENKVSYAPWVHSMTRQIPIHAARDWRKVDKIGEASKAWIVERFALSIKTFTDFWGRR